MDGQLYPLELEGTWPPVEDQQTPAPASFTSSPPQDHATPILEETEEICLGTILDIKAQLRNPNHAPFVNSYSEVLDFPVAQEGDYFALESTQGLFARLSKGLCNCLKEIVTGRQVRIHAYVLNKDWAVARSRGLYTSTTIPLEINIYSSRTDADKIGSTLSKSKFFLQPPQHGSHGLQYYNPHILQVEGCFDPFPTEAVGSPTPEVSPEVSNRSDHAIEDSEEKASKNDSIEVDSILNSLSHHVPLQAVSVDRRIKSTLLPHQKEAMDFIFKREQGDVPSELSLWKYNDLDASEPFYQHVFSGAKRPQQDEAKSGIIADEMGLGKSLVILSTVAGSLDRAEEHVTAESRTSEEKTARTIPSRATLILAPSSLLIDSWVDEIRKHTYPGGISFHRHLGSARHKERDMLCSQMIVFTTYATVATEFCRGDNTLSSIKWFRVVLDEAHDIRNRSTKQFQAVARLEAQHRWCLTGTPIQNSLDDLGALVTFLKVPILENSPTFRKFIIAPTITNSRTRFENLRMLLQTICLRRMRELLDLPEPVMQTRRLYFSDVERLEYDDLLQQCRIDIDMAVSGHRKSRLNSTVLESLLKVRLFCNNGKARAILRAGSLEDPDEILAYLQQCEQNICIYCFGIIYVISDDAVSDGGILVGSCYHLVCRSCMPQHRTQKERCPGCESANGPTLAALLPAGDRQIQPGVQAAPDGSIYNNQYPTKLLALLGDIRADPGHKSIVFSFWKKTLILVGELFQACGIPYDMIDGSLALNERLKVLKDFRSPTGANILLMTLGTGAVGLNLAVASRIYLLEPQWNPSIESQAIGRALRLGQTDHVRIVRYVMRDTVEESSVLSRQRTKLQLAGSGFGKGRGAASERLQELLGVLGVEGSSTT